MTTIDDINHIKFVNISLVTIHIIKRHTGTTMEKHEAIDVATPKLTLLN